MTGRALGIEGIDWNRSRGIQKMDRFLGEAETGAGKRRRRYGDVSSLYDLI